MPAEQTCIRSDVGGELDSVLGERVMTDDYLKEWHVSLFECLTPETARSVYPSVLIAWIVSDETYDVTEREIQCVSEWVAGADVHRLITGTVAGDEAILAELASVAEACLPDLFLVNILTGLGVNPDSLTEGERDCLRDWYVGFDWSGFLTATSQEDLSATFEVFPGLIGCAPSISLTLLFPDLGLDPDALTDEEMECLEDWEAGLDWDALIAAIAGGYAGDDATLGLFEDYYRIQDCAPDLFTDADIGAGQSIEAAIDHGGDVDLFELSADAGKSYQIDIALGTLGDSVLTIYDADGSEVAYNDDYGGGSASRIIWEAPATGVYYVEVSGFGLDHGLLHADRGTPVKGYSKTLCRLLGLQAIEASSGVSHSWPLQQTSPTPPLILREPQHERPRPRPSTLNPEWPLTPLPPRLSKCRASQSYHLVNTAGLI